MTCPDSSENQQLVRTYIAQKHQSSGGLVPAQRLVPILTDMDLFPYPRFYRGITSCSRPRVFDREAGHRPWQPAAYQPQTSPSPSPPPNGCFQIPCSTILPCIPDPTAFKRNRDACVYISP